MSYQLLTAQIGWLCVRAYILPGGTEAKKAAEANLIAGREETAAMRCQANTAELMADHDVERFREPEVLEEEKVACADGQ